MKIIECGRNNERGKRKRDKKDYTVIQLTNIFDNGNIDDLKLENDKNYIIIDIIRNKYYLKGNKLHRENKPAIIYKSGCKFWYQNDKLHRENKPAIVWNHIDCEWFFNGKRHRIDGPAIDFSYKYTRKEWYLNNVKYSENVYNKIIEKIKRSEQKILNKYARIWYAKCDRPGTKIWENRIEAALKGIEDLENINF